QRNTTYANPGGGRVMSVKIAYRITPLLISLAIQMIPMTAANATAITFNEFASGTIINNQYPGVTFSVLNPNGTACPTCNVFDQQSTFAANPQPPVQVVAWSSAAAPNSPQTLIDTSLASIVAQFSTLQSFVSIDAAPLTFEALTPSARPFMQ